MFRQKRYRAGLVFFLLLSCVSGMRGQEESTEPLPVKGVTSAAALESLKNAQRKNEDAFVIQDDLDGLIAPDGGGACASAAGIDVLQALRLMCGPGEVAESPQGGAVGIS